MKDYIVIDKQITGAINLLSGLMVSDIESIYNSSGDQFFLSLNDQAGKCVVVNEDETGFEYAEKETKLYKHTIVDGADNYTLILITDNPTALDFTSITSSSLMKAALSSICVISFYLSNLPNNQISFIDDVGDYMYIISVSVQGNINSSIFDDFVFTNATDTVTPL